jgi:hypothetical protein
MQDPISKITKAKRAGVMVQVIECLPSNCDEALNSMLPKKKKEVTMSRLFNT